MAKVLRYDIHNVHSVPFDPTDSAVLVQGAFMSIDSNGLGVLADFRDSEGPLPARGVITMGASIKDFRGNEVTQQHQLPYVTRCRLGMTGLIPGETYYLSSGGTVAASTAPGTTGDLAQRVGFAESETVLVVEIGDADVQ